MAIYMKVPGIEGNVTAKGFDKTIQLESCELAVDRDISMETGNVANRENRSARLSTVNCILKFSKHSTGFFTEATTGDTGKDIEIYFCQTSKNEPVMYLQYKLKAALVSHYSISGQSEGDPIEQASFSYSAIEMTYSDHKSDNTLGGQQVAAFNVAENAPNAG